MPPTLRVRGAQRRQQGGGLTLDAIIPHLQRAQRQPDNSYMARCPVHDDSTPSLHLTEKDGVLLWHCFAGCSQEAVGEALRRLAGVDAQPTAPNAPRFQGCTLQQLCEAKLLNPELLKQWGVSDGRYGGVDAVRIPYLNEQGETVSVQWRVGLTGERFRRTGSPTLYGLWRLREYSGANLWATEGTSDAWVLWSAGLPALGFPSSTPTEAILQHFWDIAARFQNLYLLPDSDDAGRALVQRLAETCPPDLRERVRVVPLPEGCKDAGDLWLACNGDADTFKNRLRDCLQNAQLLPACLTGATGATGATGLTGATDGDAPLTAVVFDELPEESAPAIVDGIVYEERVSLLVGEAGIGKTTLIAEIVDTLLQGGLLWGRIQLQPARVLWVGYDHAPKHIKHLMNAYYGERPRPNLFFVESGWQEPLVPETFARWRALLEQVKPNLLVCDTLYDFFAIQDELSNTLARDCMHLLRQLIAGTGCGVILLHHPNKLLATSTSTRAAGGAHAWAAKSEVVLFMHYAPREGFPPDRFVKLTCSKNREGEPWQQVFERVGRRFRPIEEGDLPLSEWGVVKSYLETHGQASYDDLLTALQQQGFRITPKALQHRVHRWGEKGLVVARREGFPAKTIIRLARVQLNVPVSTQLDTSCLTGATGATGLTGATDDTFTDAPVAPVSPVGHGRGDCGATDGSTCPDAPVAPVSPVSPVSPVAPVSPMQSDCGATADDSDFRALLETLTRPDDPFALEPHEVDLLRTLWREAQQRNYPALRLNRYAFEIPAGREAWLQAIPKILGTPAALLALQHLTLSDTGATAPAPIPAPDGKPVGDSFAVQPQGLIAN